MSPATFVWKAGALDLTFEVNKDGPTLLRSMHLPGSEERQRTFPHRDSALPIVEVKLAGKGGTFGSTKRMVGNYASRRLQYQQHAERVEGDKYLLDIEMRDFELGYTVTSHFTAYSTIPVVRSTVTVNNGSDKAVHLQMVSSLAIGGITLTSREWWNDYRIWVAHNSWFREAQWQALALPSVGLDDMGVREYGFDSTNANFAISNHGSFSTGGHLPMGAMTRADATETWMWQIEHNGSWQWEIGDFRDSLYLAASGPVDQNHLWSKTLAPGDSFASVPVALGLVEDGLPDAFAALTAYRRRIRRPHPDNERLPVIFNDYMNCLMGDPTEEKIAALIEPVAAAGAEYFVIDCGWYSDDNGWWDTVGEWVPSKTRFPSGLDATMKKITDLGMVPGLWIEPEVVGVQSPVVASFPPDAFFSRNGERIVEKDRYHLDFRHPAVRERMDNIIDFLVTTYHVGYFKFDYNIDVTQGTDVNSSSPGDGQLEHNRAYLAWVQRILDRFPGLVIENCSSGAQRMDYAMLSVHSLQSTSDQQDPVRYAAIAASVPTAVTPEQSATWAYPQPDWDDERNALTVINSLLGRVHLSGPLNQLRAEQHRLVSEGIAVYKLIRNDLREGVPFWPLGLPQWHDNWIALGISSGEKRYLSVWRRGGETPSMDLPVPKANGQDLHVECLYPTRLPFKADWRSDRNCLSVELPAVISARLFQLSAICADEDQQKTMLQPNYSK